MELDDVNDNEEYEIDLLDYDVVEDEDSLDKDDTDCPRCHGGCNYCLMTD